VAGHEPHLAGPVARPAAGEPFAVAVVVRVDRPVSARAGDRAVVTADGRLQGWVGGSCAEPVVVREALAALADRRPRLVRIRPVGQPAPPDQPGVVTELTACASEGGLDVFVEPRLPAARLLVAGSSPAARALARLAAALGEHVTAVLDDPGGQRLPGAEGAVAVAALAESGLDPADAVVVATMNRYDEAAVRAALATRAGYVGLVASRRRGQALLTLLAQEGVPAADLARVRTPAGLDLGPSTQEEIAVAILAELIAWRHERQAALTRSPALQPAAVEDTAAPPATMPQTATDPVCGMTVPVIPSTLTTESAGQRFWFCNPGCRDAFTANPARYAEGSAPPV
jgi:xanthine dehydrogenase accessory factor